MNKVRLLKTSSPSRQHQLSRRASNCSRNVSTKWEVSEKRVAIIWREQQLTKLLLLSRFVLVHWHSRT